MRLFSNPDDNRRARVLDTPTSRGPFTFELQVASGGRTVRQTFTGEVLDLPDVPELISGQTVDGLIAGHREKLYFSINVPPGAATLHVEVENAGGDYGLKAEAGMLPSVASSGYGCNIDTAIGNPPPTACVVEDPGEGGWGIMVWARWSEMTDFSLRASYDLYPPLGFITTDLPDAQVGRAYMATLEASGGSGTYDWQVTAGTLPAGLRLDGSTGEIRGTPTASGLSEFTIQSIPRAWSSGLTPSTSIRQTSTTAAASGESPADPG
jgi:hypothetical protein